MKGRFVDLTPLDKEHFEELTLGTNCFEKLKAIRVQLKTKDIDYRSAL